ncbi:MAG TPA: hypothetical protein VFG55_08325 [Rhodanobacteraceae bacterium]|nr:hypothetical protein [Rhodanobacteraceae bacterium]
MQHIALVTAKAARSLDEDLAPLAAALQAASAQVSIVEWDDAKVDWSHFGTALLRSTWDYTARLPEFLTWALRVSAETRLLNPVHVVRWNTDKHYLAELDRAGVATVPSRFVEPGEDALAALQSCLADPAFGPPSGSGPAARHPLPNADRAGHGGRSDFSDFVVKPAIGAGSRDAQRHTRSDRLSALAHIKRLLDAGRSAMLQPYLDRVDEHGETALIYFNGVFSHAIRKGPLLRPGEGPTRALFAAEQIMPRVPSTEERAVADHALAAPGFTRPLLYARVDLVHDAAGMPCVLELELTEPSLFFAHAPGSAERCADAILAH